MPRRNTPDHSYFDSVIPQLELRVGRSCSGVVSNVESNAASGVFPGLNAVDTGLKAGKRNTPQQSGKAYSIVCDQLGTPTEAYDEEGQRIWARELAIYGRIGAQG